MGEANSDLEESKGVGHSKHQTLTASGMHADATTVDEEEEANPDAVARLRSTFSAPTLTRAVERLESVLAEEEQGGNVPLADWRDTAAGSSDYSELPMGIWIADSRVTFGTRKQSYSILYG